MKNKKKKKNCLSIILFLEAKKPLQYEVRGEELRMEVETSPSILTALFVGAHLALSATVAAN